jgi:hypothetical protein
MNCLERKMSWPNQSTTFPFSWRDWREPWKTSVRTASVLAEIQTQYLPNKSLEHYYHANPFDAANLVCRTNNDTVVVEWQQIQRPGFDSQCYQIFREVGGLERGPLSLVSTIKELLERKSSGSGLEIREYGRRDPSRWPRDTLCPQTLALTSLTSGGRSVGIVRSWTQETEFSFSLVFSSGMTTNYFKSMGIFQNVPCIKDASEGRQRSLLCDLVLTHRSRMW